MTIVKISDGGGSYVVRSYVVGSVRIQIEIASTRGKFGVSAKRVLSTVENAIS